MFPENRPKIKLEKSTLDLIIEYTTFGLLAMSLCYTIFYYGSLPEKVPMHFNASGDVSSVGSKASIWALYILGSATVLGLFYLNKFPHIFNYPKKITVDNAKKNYSDATRMLRYLNFGIALLFAVIGYEIVNIALSSSKKFNSISAYIVITIIVVSIVYPIIYMIKNSEKKKI